MYPGPRPHRRYASYPTLCTVLTAVLFLLAACGGDNGDDTNDIATEPDPTPTQTVMAESDDDPAPTPEPTATEDSIDDTAEPHPTPTEVAEEPTPDPADDVDLAPKLAGLTDWRNTDPVELEDLRGEPVVLVFWNSI